MQPFDPACVHCTINLHFYRVGVLGGHLLPLSFTAVITHLISHHVCEVATQPCEASATKHYSFCPRPGSNPRPAVRARAAGRAGRGGLPPQVAAPRSSAGRAGAGAVRALRAVRVPPVVPHVPPVIPHVLLGHTACTAGAYVVCGQPTNSSAAAAPLHHHHAFFAMLLVAISYTHSALSTPCSRNIIYGLEPEDGCCPVGLSCGAPSCPPSQEEVEEAARQANAVSGWRLF